MDRYVLVRNNVVENVIAWDGVSPWDPPEGVTMQRDPGGVGPGWIRQEDGTFVSPIPPEPEPQPEEA